MVKARVSCLACATAALIAAVALGPVSAYADHTCDPVDPVADLGWSVVPTHETIGQVDGAAYQVGTSGDWFIDRTTTMLPFCNYYNAIGIYSMRSYTLSPRATVERIGICKSVAQGAGAPVPPYAGPCPPK